jgi:hypothetical protein
VIVDRGRHLAALAAEPDTKTAYRDGDIAVVERR